MKTSSSDHFRMAPQIPDHEMLRLIGKGSYGEVWLARSVTGAMRAVKVVQRSDFQHEKTFEREFEGIRKFEPISRSHPGLVDVLHVGRNLDKGFYYYVMELGDDQTRGTEIIPELYVARTLSSDINQREHGRLSVDECLDAGANLADGLQYLHQNGSDPPRCEAFECDLCRWGGEVGGYRAGGSVWAADFRGDGGVCAARGAGIAGGGYLQLGDGFV